MKNNSTTKANNDNINLSFGRSPNLDFYSHICSPLFNNKNFLQTGNSRFIDYDFLNSSRRSDKIVKIDHILEEQYGEKLRNILTPTCKRADSSNSKKILENYKINDINNELLVGNNYKENSFLNIFNGKSAFKYINGHFEDEGNNFSNINNTSLNQINSTIFPPNLSNSTSTNFSNSFNDLNNNNTYNNKFNDNFNLGASVNINITTNNNYNIFNNYENQNKYNKNNNEDEYNFKIKEEINFNKNAAVLLKKKRGRKSNKDKAAMKQSKDGLNNNNNSNYEYNDYLNNIENNNYYDEDNNQKQNYEDDLPLKTTKVTVGEHTEDILKNIIKATNNNKEGKLKMRRFKKDIKNLTLEFDKCPEIDNCSNKNECKSIYK